MKFTDCKLLTDENLHPQVVWFLRGSGFDVVDVVEQGWVGAADVDLLRRAFAENRVVVTHDSDFGTLAIHAGEPLTGILFLRPGHIDPQFTIETIQAVLKANRDLFPPFILVARRKGNSVTIRLRVP